MNRKLKYGGGPLHLLGMVIACLILVLFVSFSGSSYAATAKEIYIAADVALERFHSQVPGAGEYLKNAAGVLVFPGVVEAGLGVGGEYGEGVLRINGKTVDYYRLTAGSVGIQIGAQKKDIILVFLDKDALKNFRDSAGWEVGVDGSVTLINVGVGGSIDTTKTNKPIVGFVFGQKGLMGDVSIEGARFTKLKK